ncbi:MAG: PAS domain-containing protein [Chloroflexota bacterium]|nr:PAS domain-containing protein [Chloroflexota bacterium]
MPEHDIIVIGASAGGVEALVQLIHALPANLPASVFIVLHIPAHSTSMLPQILSRAGVLPVVQPVDYQKIEARHVYVAPPDHHLLIEQGYMRVVRGPGENQYSEQEAQPPALEVGQLRRFNELLLRFLPIGIVVIDHSYHILTANGAARRMLGLRDVATEQDFLHAVRGVPYHEARSAIDAVFRERTFVTLLEVELETTSGGNGRFVSLSISLLQLEPGLPDLAAMSVTDVNEQVQIRRQLENVQVEQTQLKQELGTANKRLSDMNKELMDANEELQVANEELVLTHEELQASIEEFETTNEELQTTNEELQTTNEELRARNSELQEMTSILENEKVRLAEMVELAPFYILVLRGPSLIVEAYNPRYTKLLAEREVLGHPLEEVIDLLWEPEAEFPLLRFAREVYIQDTPKTIPSIHTFEPESQRIYEGQQEGYFSYTIVPSHTTSGRVNGVIIYTTNETEQHA